MNKKRRKRRRRRDEKRYLIDLILHPSNVNFVHFCTIIRCFQKHSK